MLNHINILLRQAVQTFSGSTEVLAQNIDKLRTQLDKTLASDIGFKEHELLRNEIWQRIDKAPVTYVDIYEDERVSVGVFVLKPGMKLPLHDHPQMYGLIKVIGGKVQISSYTITNTNLPEIVEAEAEQPVLVDATDKSVMLAPTYSNLHEIESVGGAAAFLDILSPPYDTLIEGNGPRKCTYYEVMRQIGLNKFLLKTIDSPSWFWTDCYPYKGPQIIANVTLHAVESESQ